ncbi:hypothetical protein LTS18_012699, partial [Coniosporium uncinatum]
MLARRLVFLLSIFLPSNSGFPESILSGRPGTSSSFRGYSKSPPPGVSLSREVSLRRTINRRAKSSHQRLRRENSQPDERSLSTSNPDAYKESDSRIRDLHSRRPSDAISIKHLTVSPDEDNAPTRKSSATTTSTVTPTAAVSVAHFVNPRQSLMESDFHRADCQDSVASDLKQSLHRNSSGTDSIDSQSGSRWGSFKSFWSAAPRRESSTDYSDVFQYTDEGLGISAGKVMAEPEARRNSKLEEMVRELHKTPVDPTRLEVVLPPQDTLPMPQPHIEVTNTNLHQHVGNAVSTSMRRAPAADDFTPSLSRPIPQRKKTTQETLKMSVNSNDGVIDVQIPNSDFGSPLQSPPIVSFNTSSSYSSLGQSSIWSQAYVEPDRPMNVAGFLGRFHPDFSMQATGSYSTLEQEIREAMRTEPTPASAITTPSLDTAHSERWVDVCSSLIADANTFTIKRLRLRRL